MDDLQTKLKAAAADAKISQESLTNITKWLANDQLTEFHTKIDTLVEKEDWSALNDAFYMQIEFGTAGIRGKTGLGSARINRWTIGSAAQGLANYLLKLGDAAKLRGVIIGSDTRLTSPEFVALVANILTSNGIKVYRFNQPPQVGMFSFAVRLYKAQAGVYISASHNPPSDNGFKCYWEDGAQVLPPHDKAITEAVAAVDEVNDASPDNSLITEIGEEFNDSYRIRVLHESVSEQRGAHIVYSPFHGTGQYGVLPILRDAGFQVTTVDEQMAPDGNFPNVPGGVPNPQNRESNALTAKKVLETGADLGISTDPDADRLGLVVPQGETTAILDGNQTAVLLAYYICTMLQQQDKLPKNGFLVRTAVTTPLLDAIATDFGLAIYNDLPVGFKFIGETIQKHEDFGDELFIFGAEESFGSLKGSYARDKDASVAALIAAEMISWLKANGRTVWELFDEIYGKYGFYLSELMDLKFEGAEGFDKMSAIMSRLRQQPPTKIGEWPVVQFIDRGSNEIKDSTGAVIGKVDGHTTNMLVFNLSEDGKNSVVVRPSGTEPKMKLYLSLSEKADSLEKAKDSVHSKAEQLKSVLKEFLT